MTEDVADYEVELIPFNCFRLNPHYYYGPNDNSERIFMVTNLVEGSMEWVLDQFKGGNIPSMIERAGYPSIAASLDIGLVDTKVAEVETTIKAMAKADPR